MKWRTKEGKDIELCEMDDQHLRNSITMVKKRIANREHELKCSVVKTQKKALHTQIALSNKTLKALIEERQRRDFMAFDGDTSDIKDELEFITRESKEFMDMLGEL